MTQAAAIKFCLKSKDGRFVSQQGATPVLVKSRAWAYTFTEQDAKSLIDLYSRALRVELEIAIY